MSLPGLPRRERVDSARRRGGNRGEPDLDGVVSHPEPERFQPVGDPQHPLSHCGDADHERGGGESGSGTVGGKPSPSPWPSLARAARIGTYARCGRSREPAAATERSESHRCLIVAAVGPRVFGWRTVDLIPENVHCVVAHDRPL